VERSAETTRDDPDGEYLKRNRWFESGSLHQRVCCEPDFLDPPSSSLNSRDTTLGCESLLTIVRSRGCRHYDRSRSAD
jgi:hypothetical protein